MIAAAARWPAALLLAGLLLPAASPAQHDHGSMPADSGAARRPRAAQTHDMGAHEAMEHRHGSSMRGLYGPYPMSRETSGTAWQPDRAGHQGIHATRGSWTLMLHAMADLVYDDQGSPRGDDKFFSANMVMAMARRDLGPGTFGLRAMLSAEPATIGKEGYPLLLQTGETADGETHLIDRQHPHDLFMELAATYSVSSGKRALFVYGGLPGEPALGPPAFMHRFSGMSNPMAPLAHHWLDSSHITFGVLSAGLVWGGAKLEASAFRGREPNQNRYDIESPDLDSHSFRLSLNPGPAWSLQGSYGRLHSPEQLEPEVNVDRTTASAMVAGEGAGKRWGATAAWGRNRNRPGPILDAFSVEGALELRQRHTFFARAERAEKNELFQEDESRHGQVFDVGAIGGGYRFDFWRRGRVTTGIGVAGTVSFVADAIRDVYGRNPTSALLFGHIELR